MKWVMMLFVISWGDVGEFVEGIGFMGMVWLSCGTSPQRATPSSILLTAGVFIFL